MAQFQGDFATGKKVAAIEEVSNSVVSEVFDYVIPVAGALAAGDIIEIGRLPAYATICDAILISDKVDTGTTITLDVGIMSGTPGDTTAGRTCGNELFAASVNGQAGVVERMTKLAGFTIAETDADRAIGVKVVAAPVGLTAGNKIRVRVSYHQ